MSRAQQPLRDRIATTGGKRQYVRTLFATIADRYDAITVLLSFGRDRRWKARLIALARPAPSMRALDLATGTGDIAFALASRVRRVVGLDVTHRMIELAMCKGVPGARPDFVVGDMMSLPFPAGSFDLVTTGYGLRNVPELDRALSEIERVLKPGGQLLALDFNRPSNALVRSAYLGYLWLVGGMLGWVLHRNPETYQYIPASIRTYPGAAGVAGLMRSAGFSRVAHHPVLGGLMAIHHAFK